MLIVQVQTSRCRDGSEVMVQRWCRVVEVQNCREGPEQVQKCRSASWCGGADVQMYI
jgi:hypothetical protein